MNARQRDIINDRAVRRLVDAHVGDHGQPLLLAVRYRLDSPDVHLLEVLDGFPGDPNDAPFTTEFAPSAELLLLGKLHLTLVNRAQFLRIAASNRTALGRALRAGRLEYVGHDESALAESLGLEHRLSPSELSARKALEATFKVKTTEKQRAAIQRSWTGKAASAKS